MTVAFDGLREAGVATRTACTLTGRARASHYRRLRPPPVRHPPIPQSERMAPTQALSPAEKAAVLGVLNTVGNADLSIGQVWVRELDEGRYWCSLSSMYRIAAQCHHEFPSSPGSTNPNQNYRTPDHRTVSLDLTDTVASWGMMRGSGQLLQNSVRGLAPVVKLIAEVSASTWELDVHLYADHADEVVDLGGQIRDGFSESNVHASDTLVTKTMLGVFGCVPAFDRYFRIGSGLRLFSEKSLRSIGRFYEDNQAEIDAAQVPTLDFLTGNDTERHYPRAKIIDAVFFQNGYGGN
jgi:hypothetical protein